nr:alpha-hydroxy acid oxidase [Altererythrobacter lutimaris]
MSDCISIADLRQLARRRAHRMVFDYIDGGAEDEVTMSGNVDAFVKHRFVHRVLRDVSALDPSIEIFGQRRPLPFFLSPTAGNRLFHTDGEVAVAHAAGEAGIVSGLSTLGSTSIEDFCAAGTGPKWFQTYVWKDRELTREMLLRAKAAGFETLVVTVDMPVHGSRERDHRNGFAIPPKIGLKQTIQALRAPRWTLDYLASSPIRYANLSQNTSAISLADFVNDQLDPAFCWDDAAELISHWSGSTVLKGVVHPDDAKRAVEIGFDAIQVSNHGGRQLDRDVAPLDALPAIRKAVGEQVPLILDSGVRRGSDILTALICGADAVSCGRAYLYGLAAGGEAGVARSIEILKDELLRSMALLGVASIRELLLERGRWNISTTENLAVHAAMSGPQFR